MTQYKTYKPLLLKNAEQSAVRVVDSSREWNIFVKSCPFQLLPEQKELPANDWDDENGEEVFFPTNPKYKAYDLKITFLCLAEEGTANDKIKRFWDFLQFAPLEIYDTYTQIGRRQIYYKSFSPISFYRRDGNNDIVEFSLLFRVCDPITDVVLTLSE